MKRFLSLALILGLLLIPCIRVSIASEAELRKVYEAAKKEGEVNFWGPMDAKEIAQLAKEFNKKFPGIKINLGEITGGDATEKVIMEHQAGRYSVDVADTTMTLWDEIKTRDIPLKVNWSELFDTIPKQSVYDNGYAVDASQLQYPIIYNTNMLSPNQLPKSWEELLDPKWKSKIIVESRGKIWGLLAALAWGEEKTTDYVRKLKDQKPIFMKGGTTVLQLLIAGEAPLGIGSYLYKVPLWQRQKAPVDWLKISPLCTEIHMHYIIKKAAHPNAAILWAGWMATAESQKLMETLYLRSSVYPWAGTNLSKEVQKYGVKAYFNDTVEKAKKTEEFQEKYIKILGVK